MPFITIITTLQEPLLTIHAIYNKPLTPRRGGFKNHLKYDTSARRRLVDFIKSYNWACTAIYAKLSIEIKLYIFNFIIKQLLKKEGF